MKPKRTQADRNYDLFHSLKQSIFGHWVDVRKTRCTFEEYLRRAQEMRQRLVWQGREKLPDYKSFALDSYNDALYTQNAFEKVWVHVHDGRAYLSWDSLPEAGKEATRKAIGDHQLSGHVWAGPEVVDGALLSTLKPWSKFSA